MPEFQYKPSVERFGRELSEKFESNRLVVFLCGPSLRQASPGSHLRKTIQNALLEDNFEVVLGEDDGLEELRSKFKSYAHVNELEFIKQECGAIVVVADSPGSFSELGLFAHLHSVNREWDCDLVAILKREHENDQSYINEGPALAIKDYGALYYGDFANFEIDELLERLRRKRTLIITDGRGRPRKNK